jgi:hypothetical protein
LNFTTAKPTKADKYGQEAFKKALKVLYSLKSSPDIVVYALDETIIVVESDNRYSWSTVGAPPVFEKNGSHKGINMIGYNCILNNYHTVNDVYTSGKPITSNILIEHLKYLLEINAGKKL